MQEQVLEPLEPKPLAKPMHQSRTTQDVAAGTALSGVAGGTTAYGLILAARAILGDAKMPWTPEMDGNVALAAALAFVPLVSRLVARFRRGTVTPNLPS